MKTKPMMQPLSGIHITELSGIGPVPYAGQLLADMGASITRVQRPNDLNLPIENRNKKILTLDLKSATGRRAALKLIKNSDVVLEGSRPGIMEKLGLGPSDCHRANPKIIYGRMTGWGQTGPWANKAGHDINYIGLTGALHAMGHPDRLPTPPINLLGDYGGGSQFLVMGILAALLSAQKTGEGCVIDAAIIDGVFSMMGIVNSLDLIGMWTPERGTNLLDGSRPYYRCYATQDKKFMAVGCLEPKFYDEMLNLLEVESHQFGGQSDPNLWPAQSKTLTLIFQSQSLAYCEALFERSDACVTPVLDYAEAPLHKHNKARNISGAAHPAPAPRFPP